MRRENIIRRLVRDKRVLDVGSAGQTNKYSLWNQYPLFGVKEVVGIDLEGITNENSIIFGRESTIDSPNIVIGDMETYEFDRRFDVVVAGDVIEHVMNQGMFLQNIHRHLESEGILIITTPNAKWPTVFLRPNPTHSLWHDKYTLTRILDCAGFVVNEFYYYKGNKQRYVFPLNIMALQQGLLVVCTKKHSV